ncbi:TetR/AcrR family transcriptional regulator [Evansella cellulosilytica]|uniref:Transcriptional regulator, TetR family n=1 Tax=Evansella cellulosilytica (strain ATCC 21833 / DSM 2522 / FERM P-1141 / JCM 9156 / N-4) TaxID=649639 RepID=E6TZZ6_EVAC2|nr:TetR/AcrR family transcriptional regulator [Evansella cellulosilytica]ADU29000.1 transcriptional regulator, TetR family [Evansella cellulosilytica DSM 2522]
MMASKEKLILEAAIKLFSIKGFDATSIQDIANECGIAKGSFYSYFKSKDVLLLETLNYYFSNIESRVKTVGEMDLAPRDKFVKQLAYFFEGVFEHKEFIITQAYEQAIPLNESIKQTLFQKQNKTRRFFQNGLLSLYGEEVKPYLWDLSIMLEGMFHSYIRMFLIDENGLEINKLALFIVNRIDDIVTGLMKTKEAPILSKNEMEHINKILGLSKEDQKLTAIDLLEEMKSAVEHVEDNNDILITLEVLEEELSREKPRDVVIQGMLANLNGIAKLESQLKELKSVLTNG